MCLNDDCGALIALAVPWARAGKPRPLRRDIDRWNRRAHLATETAAIQKVRDGLAKWGEAMPTSVVRQCVAALDAILEGRKK